MLLFSTLLELNESITPDDFIRLVLKWNETSSRIENRVPGIEWHGEHNIRYGTDTLWPNWGRFWVRKRERRI